MARAVRVRRRAVPPARRDSGKLVLILAAHVAAVHRRLCLAERPMRNGDRREGRLGAVARNRMARLCSSCRATRQAGDDDQRSRAARVSRTPRRRCRDKRRVARSSSYNQRSVAPEARQRRARAVIISRELSRLDIRPRESGSQTRDDGRKGRRPHEPV